MASLLLCMAGIQVILLVSSSLTALAGGPLAFGPEFAPGYARLWPFVLAHGTAACLLLLIGPCLLLRRYLKLPPGWHTKLGKLYLMLTVIAALAGLPMAFQAKGGKLASASFLGLSLAWLVASLGVYQSARQRRWDCHQRWVRFHYLLSFSAVWLRMQLGLATHLDYTLEQSAGWAAWLSQAPAWIYAWLARNQLQLRLTILNRANTASPAKRPTTPSASSPSRP